MNKRPIKLSELRIESDGFSKYVRVIHLPTGKTVECSSEDSYSENKLKAINTLEEMLNAKAD